MLRTICAFLVVAAFMLSGCVQYQSTHSLITDENFAREYAKIRNNVGVVYVKHSGFFRIAGDPPRIYRDSYRTSGRAGVVIYKERIFVLSAGHLFEPNQRTIKARKKKLAKYLKVPPGMITYNPGHKETLFVKWRVRGKTHRLEFIFYESYDIRKREEALKKSDFAVLRLSPDDEKKFASHAFELGSTKNLKVGDLLWATSIAADYQNNTTIPIRFLEPVNRPYVLSEAVNKNTFSYYGLSGKGLSGSMILEYKVNAFKIVGVLVFYSSAYKGASFGFMGGATKIEAIIAKLDELIKAEKKTKKPARGDRK